MQRLQAEIGAALHSLVREMAPVTGGCISPAWHAQLDNGASVFIKSLPEGGPAGLLQAEALSLTRIRETEAIRVPDVLHVSPAWLALEWLPPAAASSADWRTLGRGLALLHRTCSSDYGWEADNFIGRLPQHNSARGAWTEFWVEQRLRPQLQATADMFAVDTRDAFKTLFADVAPVLERAEADGASLLHGDLWNGNVHMSSNGPALIDPSSYFGHREVDLAMARLFGGFPRDFFAAYEAEWPLLPDAEARVPLYQLYYLLVHVRLFGAGYIAQTERALQQALRTAV
jgi:fructosamine-3-kinase